MIGLFINLIIWLVVIGILYAVADYVISNLIPEPPQRIAKVVLIVIVAIVVVLLLLQLVGVDTGVGQMPKLT
jgi:uncharacterized membrane protein